MIGQPRLRALVRLVLAASLAAAWAGGWTSPPDAAASGPSRWTGGVDLYRAGSFTTQKTWLWCTAADVQIIRNIVAGAADHSGSTQQRYFDYMRARNRYDIPARDGVDPAGWTAGLRHFVDSRYRLTISRSFDAALRAAVTNLRRTNLPVGITVSHGNHAWVLTGFTATADPAVTTRFTITSVRVVGPLWGLQSSTYGYDMRPDTKLTPKQLQAFFTPWHYASVKMSWEGRWVSVQPVTATAASPKPAATAAPKPAAGAATAAPTVLPAASLSPPPAPSSTPEPIPSPASSPAPSSTSRPAPATPQPSGTPAAEPADAAILRTGVVAALIAVGLVTIGGASLLRRRRP